MSLGHSRHPHPPPSPRSPAPCWPHQRDDEALSELQEVAPQHRRLHIRRPLLLQALGVTRAEPKHQAWVPLPRGAPHPQRYLQQPSEQGLVSVEVGRVRGVEAWGGQRAACSALGVGAPPPAVPAPLPAPARPQGPSLGPGRRGTRTWLGVQGLQPRGLFQFDLLGKVPYETHPTAGPQGLSSVSAGSDPTRPHASPQGPWVEAETASPDILGSPTRRMWGQCWSVLIKKGFVTPRTTFGLEREKKGGKEARRGGGRSRGRAGEGRGRGRRLRGLRARGKLLELAVMDGEVGAVIAAELEGLQAAAGVGALRAVSTRGGPWAPAPRRAPSQPGQRQDHLRGHGGRRRQDQQGLPEQHQLPQQLHVGQHGPEAPGGAGGRRGCRPGRGLPSSDHLPPQVRAGPAPSGRRTHTRGKRWRDVGTC